MRRIRDRVLLGIVTGLGANVVKEAMAESARRAGLAKYTCRRMAPHIFLKRRQADSWKGQVIGTSTDMVIAVATGILLTYTLSHTGRDHKYIKGIIIGNGILDQVFGLFARLVPKVQNDLNSNLLCRGIHTIFGVTASWLATTLGDPSLFEPNPGANEPAPAKQRPAAEEAPAAASNART